MSHTPGPWRLDTLSGDLLSSDCIRILRFDTYKTSIQDAQLIATAPEMVEALERARSHFRELYKGRFIELASEQELLNWVDEIDAVLERARGQA